MRTSKRLVLWLRVLVQELFPRHLSGSSGEWSEKNSSLGFREHGSSSLSVPHQWCDRSSSLPVPGSVSSSVTIMIVTVKVIALAKRQVLFFAFYCMMIVFDALGELPGLFINTPTLPIRAPGRSVLPTHLGVSVALDLSGERSVRGSDMCNF